eukprot:TRINITY_DN21731_c0_g1_i1.p1 TRINITY_DN21731_c0_g1~~TRINITY_DN21731_c0_g1_i1.p1  ORF type:complete len:1762 (+),score=417.34 TRINITY_DN21731_c0_g1_i1:236-5287(+)
MVQAASEKASTAISNAEDSERQVTVAFNATPSRQSSGSSYEPSTSPPMTATKSNRRSVLDTGAGERKPRGSTVIADKLASTMKLEASVFTAAMKKHKKKQEQVRRLTGQEMEVSDAGDQLQLSPKTASKDMPHKAKRQSSPSQGEEAMTLLVARKAKSDAKLVNHRDSLRAELPGKQASWQDNLAAINKGLSDPDAFFPPSPQTSIMSGRGEVEKSQHQASSKLSSPSARAFQQLHVFRDCNEAFLYALAACTEHVSLKPGGVRELTSRMAVHSEQAKPTIAVIMLSGTCRVEINGSVVQELLPGQVFGLAAVLVAGAGSLGSKNSAMKGSAGAAAEATLRCTTKGKDHSIERQSSPSGGGTRSPIPNERQSSSASGRPRSCSFLLLRATDFRSLLHTSSAEDQAILAPTLQMLSRTVDATKPILAALQCNEGCKNIVSRTSTRHLFSKGETVVTQGKRNLDGLVLLLSGSMSLDIGGVEVKHISDGQVLGEDMLLNVSKKWMFTATCLTPCDVIILHRRPFTAVVKEVAQNSSSAEDILDTQRLTMLLEGRWKEDRVILTMSLFRGFDGEFLAALAKLMETRVAFPGTKAWESNSGRAEGQECSLFVLLHGSADELMVSTTKKTVKGGSAEVKGQEQPPSSPSAQDKEARKVRRAIAPGAFGGSREILGLQVDTTTTVIARTMCLVNVLHRAVFLHALNQHQPDLSAPQVTKLLKEELDEMEPQTADDANSPTLEELQTHLSVMRGLDEAFINNIRGRGSRRFCMEGQHLISAGVESSTLFFVLRGQVHTTLDGVTLHHYSRGQAFNTLGLASPPFVPSHSTTCTRASEVWALPRSELLAALEQFPSVKLKLVALTTLQVINATHVGGRFTKEGNARRSSLELEGPGAQAVNLKTLTLFKGCSADFLLWIQEHLEPRILFPDLQIFREGEPMDSLYLMCKGTVILESSNDRAQVSISRGGSMGEPQLLGVAEAATSTAVVLETSLVQVLHRHIFLHGLEKFPSEVAHFDNYAVSWLHAQDLGALSNVSLFQGCSQAFYDQVSRFAKSRLVHAGEAIVEKGATSGPLCIIRSGTAIVEESRKDSLRRTGSKQSSDEKSFQASFQRIGKWEAVNAELVLGMTSRAPATVKAERVCAITEIEAALFLMVLQRFRTEVPALVSKVSGGQLWPLEADSVPFLSGISPYFFSLLMQETEWTMFLPDKTVVRQGGDGTILFLLCHGSAICKVDGIVVGNMLVPGDVVGAANFLGISTKYAHTVRTQTVCHFRRLTNEKLNELLPMQPTERENFEQMARQEKAKAAEDRRQKKAEVKKEKLRRRVDKAFRQHVSTTREARIAQGTIVAEEDQHQPAPAKVQDQLLHRRGSDKYVVEQIHVEVNLHQGDTVRQKATEKRSSALSGKRRLSGATSKRSSSSLGPAEAADMDENRKQSLLRKIKRGKLKGDGSDSDSDSSSAASFSSSGVARSRQDDEQASGRATPTRLREIEVNPRSLLAKGKLGKRRDKTGIQGRLEKLRRRWLEPWTHSMKGAIGEYCFLQNQMQLKGRLLRAMRNGYPLGEEGFSDSSSEDAEYFNRQQSYDSWSNSSLSSSHSSEDDKVEASGFGDSQERMLSNSLRKPPKVLAKKDLKKLSQVLPPCPQKDKKEKGTVDKASMADDLSPSRAIERALQNKFQKLTQVVPLQGPISSR